MCAVAAARHGCGTRRAPVIVGSPREGGRQNLMLPIMLATFVVRSLIVGATVDEAR
jgi:hypothetical protein